MGSLAADSISRVEETCSFTGRSRMMFMTAAASVEEMMAPISREYNSSSLSSRCSSSPKATAVMATPRVARVMEGPAYFFRLSFLVLKPLSKRMNSRAMFATSLVMA